MGRSSQVLLDLEGKKSSTSSIDSRLLVCNNDDFSASQTTKTKPPDGKPMISSVPNSQVLGKVKDFLGVMSEANKRLQLDAMDNSKDYDIEALTGNETEYIEMVNKGLLLFSFPWDCGSPLSIIDVLVQITQDLMLGIADLHTPESINAAESAMAGYQPVVSLAASNIGVECEDSSDDNEDSTDDEDDDASGTCFPTKLKRTKPGKDESSGEEFRILKSKKRRKIVELS